jgi:cyclopropane fatty-acyl-phospholipid synthase-like methyltransferase
MVHPTPDETHWSPRRARWFNQAIQESEFPAQVMQALLPLLADCRSVLDVGAGVGALSVPLATVVPRVTALEPAPAMLAELQANLARHQLTNVTCLRARWGEVSLPPHDLILAANVAPIFADLPGFLATAAPLAARAIALVQNAGSGGEKFYVGELSPLLFDRPHLGRGDYLTTLTRLHDAGIYANVQVIAYQFDQPFADFQEAVDFWTERLHLTEPEQLRRLAAFLATRLQPAGTRVIAPMRRRSAVIWWPVSPRESA